MPVAQLLGNKVIKFSWSAKKSTPQFHTDPLGSTHRFHTRTIPFQRSKSLSSTPKTSQFNTKIPQFHTKNPSVPHRKSFSATHPSVPHRLYRAVFCLRGVLNWEVWWTEGFLLWNWGVLMWNWGEGGETEEFMMWNWGRWNWGFFGVELRGF